MGKTIYSPAVQTNDWADWGGGNGLEIGGEYCIEYVTTIIIMKPKCFRLQLGHRIWIGPRTVVFRLYFV